MLLFSNFYRISFSFKVSRNYKTGCFFWVLSVRRLTRWISQIIAAKLIQYLLYLKYLVWINGSLLRHNRSFSKWIIFDTFQPLLKLLIFPFLISSDVLCSVRHYLVLCWKIHLFLPLQITDLHDTGGKKTLQILYLKLSIPVIIIKDLVPLTLDEPLTISTVYKSSH